MLLFYIMDYIVSAFTMLIMDAVYLQASKPMWGRVVRGIQGSDLQVRMTSAVGVYILLLFALYYYVILPGRSVMDAALLGFAIYGVFDLTNYAIFKNYSLMAAVIDMFWGGALFAATAYITKAISR